MALEIQLDASQNENAHSSDDAAGTKILQSGIFEFQRMSRCDSDPSIETGLERLTAASPTYTITQTTHHGGRNCGLKWVKQIVSVPNR